MLQNRMRQWHRYGEADIFCKDWHGLPEIKGDGQMLDQGALRHRNTSQEFNCKETNIYKDTDIAMVLTYSFLGLKIGKN